ncbi:acyclic terpene utilization AtuA family protein [Actinomadura alba]|uniref:acyclic terpene utilization AtuA family protein n=1 Tax=Actinomadura alba TaxID=406431 RepID=UPI0031D4ABFD
MTAESPESPPLVNAHAATAAPVRIGNASGFYGDRFSAVREMLEGGPLDVLTGDYLAELTMLILGRARLKDPSAGYATTFLRQMEECLGLALDRGVAVVANAGGLNPASLAAGLRELAERLGLQARIAHVEGDDLLSRAAGLGPADGAYGPPLTANAYLGAWGIAECLKNGAQIVVTGRVTDASLVIGPAAAHFGWSRDDWDALAGATVAGHVLECGAQATGGNFSFFEEIPLEVIYNVKAPGAAHFGFPIAEVHRDGSSVITKHPGTGGAVTTETVTAQLLYEIAGPRYAGPDVTTRFDTIVLTDVGPDRVRVAGVRGEPPPTTIKVCLNHLGGFRNEVTFVLTGLDIEAKAGLVRRQMEQALNPRPRHLEWQLARTDHADAAGEQEASALLRCAVKDADRDVVGRAFSGAAVELALASYPGFTMTAPPGAATPYGVYVPAYVDRGDVEHVAVLPDGSRVDVAASAVTALAADPAFDPVADPVVADLAGDPGSRPGPPAGGPGLPDPPEEPALGTLVRVPLGRVAGARSGDKGGDANIGVWARTDEQWRWLVRFLTADRLRRLLPETRDHPVTRHVLPNLRAVNFVVEGLLQEGVSASTRFDPQGKALGEWLRSRVVELPEVLL